MTSDETADAAKPGTYYLHSNKPPEEAFIFGFRGSDIKDIWVPVEDEEAPASPDDWGFTCSNEDGICKYCQLMLHPRAPKIIQHQPNLATIIASSRDTPGCDVCKWVEISLVKGSPQLVERFQQGDPTLCDPESTSCAVTVELKRTSAVTRAIASVGTRDHFASKGNLFSRVFWQPYETRDRTNPAERLNILKDWLSDCQKNHEKCSAGRSGTGKPILPTRVIDLTGSQDVPSEPEDIQIKLRETSEEEVGEYIALSYCWGQDQEKHFKTTQQNLEDHKDKIHFDDIPLTQREAILAALFLGIRYVWIDALCIIQDSSEDWEREAATMSAVYSNAALTLAATSSANSIEGLLSPFQAALCVKIHDDLAMIRMETNRDIDASTEPLNTRGWTLQESVLSPRTVSFGSEQWLWKCASRYATEDGLIDRPQVANDSLNHWYGIVNQHADDDKHEYLHDWYRLVKAYSRRELTYQDDKLKAIAGLIDVFAKRTGYEFVAGLWTEDIVNGLMWQATSRGVHREAGAIPTWSWASVSGPVLSNDSTDRSSSLITLLRVEQEWQGEPMTSALKVARLHVRGPMIKISLGKQSVSQPLRYHLIKNVDVEEIFGEAFLDNLDPIARGITEVHCLPVHSLDHGTALEHFALLLVPTYDEKLADGVDVYQRIGIGIIWEKAKFADGREASNTLVEALTADIVLV